MSEMKSFKGFIEEKNEYAATTSKAAMEKKVHQPLMAELHKKASQIEEFVGMAAAHQSEDNFRSQVRSRRKPSHAERAAQQLLRAATPRDVFARTHLYSACAGRR